MARWLNVFFFFLCGNKDRKTTFGHQKSTRFNAARQSKVPDSCHHHQGTRLLSLVDDVRASGVPTLFFFSPSYFETRETASLGSRSQHLSLDLYFDGVRILVVHLYFHFDLASRSRAGELLHLWQFQKFKSVVPITSPNRFLFAVPPWKLPTQEPYENAVGTARAETVHLCLTRLLRKSSAHTWCG